MIISHTQTHFLAFHFGKKKTLKIQIFAMNSHAQTHHTRLLKINKKTRSKKISSNDKFIVWTYEIYFLIKAIVSNDENPMDRTNTHTHIV